MSEASYHGNPNLKSVGYQHNFTKEELELKLKEVEKRYEKWQDVANTTPLQGETMLEVTNNNENKETINEDSNNTANGAVDEQQKTKEPKEIVFHNNVVNDEIVDDKSRKEVIQKINGLFK